MELSPTAAPDPVLLTRVSKPRRVPGLPDAPDQNRTNCPQPDSATPNSPHHTQFWVQLPKTKFGAATFDGAECGAAGRVKPCLRAPRLHAFRELQPAPSPPRASQPRVPPWRCCRGPSRLGRRSTHHSSRAQLCPALRSRPRSSDYAAV